MIISDIRSVCCFAINHKAPSDVFINSGCLWREPPFSPKNHVVLSTKLSLLRSLFSTERAMYALSTRPTLSVLSQKFHFPGILVNIQSYMIDYVCLTNTVTYGIVVPAEGSRCAVRLLPLLVRIGRHLPKTIN